LCSSYIPTIKRNNYRPVSPFILPAESQGPSNNNDSPYNEIPTCINKSHLEKGKENKTSEEKSPSVNISSLSPQKRKKGSYLNEKEIESDAVSRISTTSNRTRKNNKKSPTTFKNNGLTIRNGFQKFLKTWSGILSSLAE
jgi:hypothetical protein